MLGHFKAIFTVYIGNSTYRSTLHGHITSHNHLPGSFLHKPGYSFLVLRGSQSLRLLLGKNDVLSFHRVGELRTFQRIHQQTCHRPVRSGNSHFAFQANLTFVVNKQIVRLLFNLSDNLSQCCGSFIHSNLLILRITIHGIRLKNDE